jgi:hypothetical protein
MVGRPDLPLPFSLQESFNTGDYVSAILNKQRAETISSVLYPDDRTYQVRRNLTTRAYGTVLIEGKFQSIQSMMSVESNAHLQSPLATALSRPQPEDLPYDPLMRQACDSIGWWLQGKELRLKQQHFFVSGTLQDIIRRYKERHDDFKMFPEKVTPQRLLSRCLIGQHKTRQEESSEFNRASLSEDPFCSFIKRL